MLINLINLQKILLISLNILHLFLQPKKYPNIPQKIFFIKIIYIISCKKISSLFNIIKNISIIIKKFCRF